MILGALRYSEDNCGGALGRISPIRDLIQSRTYDMDNNIGSGNRRKFTTTKNTRSLFCYCQRPDNVASSNSSFFLLDITQRVASGKERTYALSMIAMYRTLNLLVFQAAIMIWLGACSRRIQALSSIPSQPTDVPFQAYQDVPQHYQSSTASVVEADEPPEQAKFVWERLPMEEAQSRADSLYRLMHTRRTVRFFSSQEIPLELIETCIATAGTAPSGAHQQPWTFCVVQDASIKSQIRELVEAEEQLNYEKRMSQDWKDSLQPIMSGLHKNNVVDDDVSSTTTNNNKITKPYLTEAPYLIVMMKQVDGGISAETGEKIKHYYAEKSCGIAAGMLCAALHNANLATVVSTPMNAEDQIRLLLDRPENERVFLLMPVGYPAEDCTVPFRDENQLRKPLDEIMRVY